MSNTLKVLITGDSSGIGQATRKLFLQDHRTADFEVIGIDKQPLDSNDNETAGNYTHYIADVRDKDMLPDIEDVNILINNAGVQNSSDDIDTNLKGLINTTEKYGLQPHIKSIVNLASVSATNGAEFPRYVASKGGVVSYTVWTAKEIAQWGAVCNSVSFGGVLTDLNRVVMDTPSLWAKIMEQTPLKKWATANECSLWIYFLSVVNRSMSGQDLCIDNLECLNNKFIWE